MTTKAKLNLTIRYDRGTDFCSSNCAFYFRKIGESEAECHLFGPFINLEPVPNGKYKRHAACINAAYDQETEVVK